MRELFPALGRYAYLNAAASSPLATPVAEAAMAHLRESTQSGDIAFPAWLRFKESLRERVSRFIGARSSQVAFTPSTAAGFHFVAELFKRRGITEVLTLESEFPSTTVPFLNLGIALRVVKPRADGSYVVDDLAAALKPTTGAIALSAVQFGSGFTIDLEAVKKLRLPLALNAAQALGQVRIDVSTGVDFLCGTTQKWMLGGYGTGLFYAREGWLEELGLPWSSWFSPPEAMRWQSFPGVQWDGDVARGVTTRRDAPGLESGANWVPLYSCGAALDLLENAGIDRIHAHNLKLQRLLRAGLEKRGFKPNAPLCSGICVVKVQGDALEAVRALLKHDVVATPRGGGVRFSTHVYNDESDVERALAAVDKAGLRP